MTTSRKAQIAAAAKCLEIAARERATLAHLQTQRDTYISQTSLKEAIKRLDEAADAIMSLKLED